MKLKLSLLVVFLLAMSVQALSQEKKFESHGFMDFNLYRDARGYQVFTLNYLASLSNRFEYFSLTNFEPSNPKISEVDNNFFYSEQHLRWKIQELKPLDLTTTYTTATGINNDNLKLGFRWRLNDSRFLAKFFKKVHLMFFINVHSLQVGGGDGISALPQIEWVYRLDIAPKIFKNRLYLFGFADQDLVWNGFNLNGSNWVTEHQLGVRVWGNLYLVTELKYNAYLQAISNTGLSFGIEYFHSF